MRFQLEPMHVKAVPAGLMTPAVPTVCNGRLPVLFMAFYLKKKKRRKRCTVISATFPDIQFKACFFRISLQVRMMRQRGSKFSPGLSYHLGKLLMSAWHLRLVSWYWIYKWGISNILLTNKVFIKNTSSKLAGFRLQNENTGRSETL